MSIVAQLVFQDSRKRRKVKRIETKTNVLATAITDIAALALELAVITDLELIAVNYTSKDTSAAFSGESDSNVDVGATFRVRLADGGAAAHKIPGFPMSKVGSNGDIDVADADVAAYFDLFKAAGPFYLSDGESLTEVLKGTLDE
jgi:hypothetical protein